MATYVIGDIQGCYEEFSSLLDVLDFRTDRDRVWFVGDLVNRGPNNVDVVRRIMAMGSAATVVLGNHDLHFLAIHRGGHRVHRADTLHDLLAWNRVDDASDWFREQSLLHLDRDRGYVMVHAGIPHIWSVDQAGLHAQEVEEVIRSSECERYFQEMYGNDPAVWQDGLTGMRRWRAITNYLTRMRLVSSDGTLDFSHKGRLEDAPSGLHPWFEFLAENPPGETILFGHWAALEGHTGLDNVVALDTGCVWGRYLTAMCLENRQFFRVESVKMRT